MANWNSTKLTCNDLQKFTEIMKTNPFTWPHTGEAENDTPVEIDKDGVVYIHSRWSVPDKEIEQLSKGNPDLIFTVDYSFESEMFDTIYKMEYKNGEGKDLGLKPSYWFRDGAIDKYKRIMGNHFDKLFDRAMEICNRIDIQKEDKIDFVTEMTFTIEDEDYQLKISKGFSFGPSNIDIECFKKIKQVTVTTRKLEPIEDPFSDNNLPLPGKDSLPF
jgi:hypothetical protein